MTPKQRPGPSKGAQGSDRGGWKKVGPFWEAKLIKNGSQNDAKFLANSRIDIYSILDRFCIQKPMPNPAKINRNSRSTFHCVSNQLFADV